MLTISYLPSHQERDGLEPVRHDHHLSCRNDGMDYLHAPIHSRQLLTIGETLIAIPTSLRTITPLIPWLQPCLTMQVHPTLPFVSASRQI